MVNFKYLCLFSLVIPLIGCNRRSNVIDVASYVDITGRRDCSNQIQNLIKNNPHRTLYFRDGTYLLDHQILTPGDPDKSVDLQLSNYAILKASDKYQAKRLGKKEKYQDEYLYMVCLGGLDRENDVIKPGSVYSLTGGIIDGNGIAGGVEIAGGRETRVQNVSMKNVEVGLRIAPGVNSGSSDADISDLSIICNDKDESYGLKLEGSDNSATNIRIGHVTHGVYVTGGTNILRNVHPLHNGKCKELNYPHSVGFDLKNFCELDNCYSDNFRIAYQVENHSSYLSNCVSWWFGPEGTMHEQFAFNTLNNQFNCSVNGFVFGIKDYSTINSQLMIGNATSGDGYIHTIRARSREKIKDITLVDGKYQPTNGSILKNYFHDENGVGAY